MVIKGVDYQLASSILEKHLSVLEEMYPTMFYVPNVAQERVHRLWYEEPYRFITLVTPGNGTGKTTAMVQDIAACLLGPGYVNSDWVRSSYYDEISPLRDRGRFKGRIVCKAEDVKEGGSVYEEALYWMPSARFTNKTSSGYYQKLTIPHPENPNIKNTVDIKTHDQIQTAHAGSNLHRIWFNEPPPPEIFGEEIGRTRSKKGEAQCYVLIYATVLDQAGYLWDMLDDSEMKDKISHVEGSIWENCAGDEIPDKAAIKLGLKRDENGVWITRGVLSKTSIENQIAAWARTCPHEADAREWGKPTHIGRVAFPTFSPDVHVIKPHPIPKRYPIVQITDPHPARPDLCGWFLMTPLGELTAIHEWPNEPYELIKTRRHTVAQMCAEYRRVEAELGIADQIEARYGDPNMFLAPDQNTLKTLQQLYAAHDFHINIWIDDNVEYGHRCISEMLYYDREKYLENQLDPLYRPKLLFFETCQNLIRHMQRYGRKVRRDPTAPLSAQFDKKYEDGAKVVQYAVVAFRNIATGNPTAKPRGEKKMTDYERMKRGRDRYRPHNDETRHIKNRRVIRSYEY